MSLIGDDSRGFAPSPASTASWGTNYQGKVPGTQSLVARAMYGVNRCTDIPLCVKVYVARYTQTLGIQ
jgi:hypothetical protein